jgi:two-component system invasion response regulator UvrY
MKSFLVLEANQIARSGIRSLITGHFPHARIEDVKSKHEVTDLLSRQYFDVIIISSFWEKDYSVGYCKSILQMNPQITIILFAANKDELNHRAYMRAGVKGCINIDEEANEEVVRSIEYILLGNSYASPGFHQPYTEVPDNAHKRYVNPFLTLSKREKQVVEQLFLGKKMNQIADFLEVRNTTVSTYKTRLFNKLNIPDQSLIKLVSLARIHNIIA